MSEKKSRADAGLTQPPPESGGHESNGLSLEQALAKGNAKFDAELRALGLPVDPFFERAAFREDPVAEPPLQTRSERLAQITTRLEQIEADREQADRWLAGLHQQPAACPSVSLSSVSESPADWASSSGPDVYARDVKRKAETLRIQALRRREDALFR